MREWGDSDDGSGGGGFQDSGSFRSSATSHSGSGRSSKNDNDDPTGSDGGDGEYDDEKFDDYESDSFEAEDDDVKDADTTSENDVDGSTAWSTGDRVQVFWLDEGAWFDGVISDCSGREFQVQYDDGDVAWERGDSIRAHPSVFGIAHYKPLPSQLLSSSPLTESEIKPLQGRAVAVYWTSEAAWFCGRVSTFEVNPSALQVTYDDGDVRWQRQAELRQVVLLLKQDDDSQGHLESSLSQPPLSAPTERVLYPRAYQAAVPDHFEPIRLAQADRYVSCVARHIGSVVVPRANYTARRYLHNVHLDCEVYSGAQQYDMGTSDSATQTIVDLSRDAS